MSTTRRNPKSDEQYAREAVARYGSLQAAELAWAEMSGGNVSLAARASARPVHDILREWVRIGGVPTCA